MTNEIVSEWTQVYLANTDFKALIIKMLKIKENPV